MAPKTVDRKELYDLVWSKPITEIAKSFGVSNSMISKICQKLDVPRPTAGHWAKVKAGKSVSIKKLRTPKDDTPATHTFYGSFWREEPSEEQKSHPLLTREDLPNFCINASMDGLKLSPEAKRNFKSFASGRTGDYNRKIATLSQHYDVRVSQDSLLRAISIIDSLVKAFRKREWEFKINQDNSRYEGMTVDILGQKIPFWIQERNKRSDHIKTDEEKLQKYYWGPKWDYTPTGELSIFLDTYPSKTFKDRKKQSLESQLNAVCKGLIEIALEKINQQEQRVLMEEARIRREIRNKALIRARQSEVNRREALETDLKKWQKAKLIREFISEQLKQSSLKGF